MRYWRLYSINPRGKLIVVTGAAQGIGLATTNLLKELGCVVIACDINKSKLEHEFANVENVHTMTVDVSSLADIEGKLVDKVKELNMQVFGVVNNAGIAPDTQSALVYKTEEEILKILSVNLLASQRVTKALYPYLARLEKNTPNKEKFIGGCVVNISSVLGRLGLPFTGYYSVTKAGTSMFSDVLRRELRSKKIRVSCIEPGAVDTTIINLSPVVKDTELTEEAEISGQLWENKVVKGGKLNPPSYIAHLVCKCLFNYRNNGYDGIETLISESYWINYLIYLLLPHLPSSITDILIRTVH